MWCSLSTHFVPLCNWFECLLSIGPEISAYFPDSQPVSQPPTSARRCTRQFFTLDAAATATEEEDEEDENDAAAAAADPDADGQDAYKKVFGSSLGLRWFFETSFVGQTRSKPARSAGYF